MSDHHTLSFSATNYYLLECDGGLLLVDAGWAGKYKRFRRELHRLDLDVRCIRFVMVTHHHHDHVALIPSIRKDADCRLIVHRDEIGYMRAGTTHTENTKQYNIGLRLLDRLISPFVKHAYDPIELNENDVVVGGDDYDISDLTGIQGRVVHTPGHSRGSISLVLADGRSFVGDVAMNMLRVFGHGYRPIEAESYSDVYDSWARLLDAGTRHVYPSHGRSFSADRLGKLLRKQNTASHGTLATSRP
jgi:glyoxylase-like metal-dependent hydrolase (beta-lactamase superfamily II)